MSGLEVVGLALGLWPVLINISNSYEAGNRSSVSLKKSLVLQEIIFKQSMQKLLQGDENLSDKDKIGLIRSDASLAGVWKDSEFISRLQTLLDEQSFDNVRKHGQMTLQALNSIKMRIEERRIETKVRDRSRAQPSILTDAQVDSIADAFKKPQDNILQTRESNRWRPTRLAIQDKEISKYLLELKQHVASLRTALESNSNTPYSAQPKLPPQRLQRTTYGRAAGGEDRKKFYNEFYEMLSQSFHCDCTVPHEANLRVSDTLEILFPQNEHDQMLPSDFLQKTRSLNLDIPVKTVPCETARKDKDASDMFRSTWSRPESQTVSSGSSEQRAVSVVFHESLGVRTHSHIGDLCQWIRALRVSPPNSPLDAGVVGGVVGRYNVVPRAQRSINEPTIVSMDDLLLELDGGGISRRTRIDLALSLAVAIERFHPTPWIDVAWTWRNFSLNKEDDVYRLCIARQFWSRENSQQQVATRPAASKFWRSIRKDPMLVRLGFAMIELALGKRLSDIKLTAAGGEAAGKKPQEAWIEDLNNWNTANELIERDHLRDETSETYQQIVATCLRCEVIEDGGIRRLSTGEIDFEEYLDQYVVEPLRQYYEGSWGQIGPLPVF